jgi:hypothetical protein
MQLEATPPRSLVAKTARSTLVGLSILTALGPVGALAQPTPAFEQVALPSTQGTKYTTVTIGPDDKLYGLASSGEIHRWPLAPDGTTGTREVLSTIPLIEGGSRLSIGLAFAPDSTESNLIAWVTHTTFGLSGMPDWGGKITRLSGPDLESSDDFVIGLPRSAKDHVTNSIEFGPDGALYFLQGSNSTTGAPDPTWSDRPERLLSAALLRLDPDLVGVLPLNARTEDGGSYDPYAPGAPLTIYAAGTRNAYDLVWHGNGQLYVPTNGSGSPGNTPAGVPGAACADGTTYAGPAVTALTGLGTQSDYLYRVEASRYYGHPNPLRCQFALGGANPTAATDPAEVLEYPVGTATDAAYGGFAFDFGAHRSPDGIIEYRSAPFGGALQGRLLVVRYSSGGDIIALTPGGLDLDIVAAETGIPGFVGFSGPLDLTENTDNGYLYVAEYNGSEITLLRPLGVAGTPEIDTDVPELIFSGVNNQTTSPETVLIENVGTAPLEITGLSIVGADAGQFQLVSPPALPFTIASGAATALDVSFSPASVGPLGAVLRITSDDTDEAVLDVGLYGLSAQGLEGGNEPPLHRVVTTLGHAIDVGGTSLSLGTSPSPIGDEVLVPLFEKAGVGDVRLIPVARYSPAFVLDFGYYLPNGAAPVLVEVGQLSGSSNPPEHQTLFPAQITGTTAFDPGGQTFGIYTTSPSHSAYTEDELNDLLHPSNVEHAVRVYPLKDRNGVPVPNAYFVGFEEASNGDYQDYDFTLHNVRPASGGTVDGDGDGFSPPADCDDTDSGVFPGATELCDNKDNDCDAAVDEGNPGGGAACATGQPGVCAAGTEQCTAGQIQCVPDTTASAEVCDGLDNDCDSAVDENDPGGGGVCGTGQAGVCAAGTQACVAGTLQCEPDQAPSTETCDGLDNDCDGTVDEGNPGGGASCGTSDVGECSLGTQQCTGGAVICVGNIDPGAELCDGLDNNCDGVVDDGNPGAGTSCSTGLSGVCAAGAEQCTAGSLVCVPDIAASPEVCDGLDNDCDGATDDGDPGGGAPCATGNPGACATGTERCQLGQIVCQPDALPSAETCNGIDDDCDGAVDQGNPGGGGACTTGLAGICGPGSVACANGNLRCEAVASAQPEICNGEDEDCDGVADDGDPGGGGACDSGQPGICAAGIEHCEVGALVCTGDVTPETEICSTGVDEDCDGATDELDDCRLCFLDSTFESSSQTRRNVIKLSASPARDRVVAKGGFLMSADASDDPDGADVTLRLGHAAGVLYEGTIAAGSFVRSANGRKYSYKDRTEPLEQGGIRQAKIVLKRDLTTARYTFKAQALDLAGLVGTQSTSHLRIGSACYDDPDDVCILNSAGTSAKCE